jgi:hypothetical protein
VVVGVDGPDVAAVCGDGVDVVAPGEAGFVATRLELDEELPQAASESTPSRGTSIRRIAPVFGIRTSTSSL